MMEKENGNYHLGFRGSMAIIQGLYRYYIPSFPSTYSILQLYNGICIINSNNCIRSTNGQKKRYE